MSQNFMLNSFSKPLRYVFYDLETTGTNTVVDQVLQTCLIETDGDLNVLEHDGGKPAIHEFKTLLRPDIIPAPEAFMVHKLNPRELYGKPHNDLLTEFDSSERIRDIFLRTGDTCMAGFNNISFDDEMVRHTNYRNLLDPYEHEWKQGNHRTDIYMLLMLTRLYGESVLNWHKNEDGGVSLKLEDTCKANGITHGASHDAKNDVLDTIALAKLVKDRKPQLFSKFKQMSDKNYIRGLMTSQQVLASTSKYISRDNYSTTMIYPISSDSANRNRYYAVDLTKDLSLLLNGSTEDIMYEIFTKNTDKTHAPIDTGIQTITANKIPILTTPSPREGEPSDAGYRKVAEKASLDYDAVKRNEELVVKFFPQIKSKINKVFNQPPQKQVNDVFVSLYTGNFLTDAEKSLRQRQRLTAPNGGGANYLVSENVVDKFKAFKENMDVHAEIILRTKWNTHFQTLLSKNNIERIDPNELIVYRNYLKKALFDNNSGLGITVDEYRQRVGKVKVEWDLEESDFAALDALDAHVDRVVALYEFIDAKCAVMLDKAKRMRGERPDDYDKCFSQTFNQKTFSNDVSNESEQYENNC
tara:strand:- start:8951 stop:10699 length:1749 start_codon:yes stop_codon:yes gene_type:complete